METVDLNILLDNFFIYTQKLDFYVWRHNMMRKPKKLANISLSIDKN